MFPQFDGVATIQKPILVRMKQRQRSTRIDYTSEVGIERAESIVEHKRQSATTNSKGCWLYNGSTNTDGYGQIFTKPNSKLHLKGRSAQKAFLLHILSFLSHRHHQIDMGQHISHLCAMRSCFNPEHLVAENAQQNNARKGCLGSIKCQHCTETVHSCPHHPRCI